MSQTNTAIWLVIITCGILVHYDFTRKIISSETYFKSTPHQLVLELYSFKFKPKRDFFGHKIPPIFYTFYLKRLMSPLVVFGPSESIFSFETHKTGDGLGLTCNSILVLGRYLKSYQLILT